MPKKTIIKRYANRKLYDTDQSRYITLDHIADMVKDGRDVRVVDSKTGDDLTQVTLAQVILEEERKIPKTPRVLLRNVIQSGGGALGDFYKKRVAEPVASLREDVERKIDMRVFSQRASETLDVWQRRIDERVQYSLATINKASQAANEIKNLRNTVRELEKRIATLEAKLKQ